MTTMPSYAYLIAVLYYIPYQIKLLSASKYPSLMSGEKPFLAFCSSEWL